MFHKINIFIFSTVFLIAIFFPILSFAQASKFYQISLNYNKGSLQLKNVVVLPGDISKVNQGGSYKLELLSLLKASLYKTNFDIPTSVHGEEFNYATGEVTGRESKLDTLDLVVNIPYFPNGKEIEIYDSDNKKVLTISVAHFAEVSPTPISPTPPFKVTKLEKGIGAFWIIGGGVLIFVTIGIGMFVYLRLKKPQNLLR